MILSRSKKCHVERDVLMNSMFAGGGVGVEGVIDSHSGVGLF